MSGDPPLNSLNALLSPGLLDNVASRYGAPVVARLPASDPAGDQSTGLPELLASFATAEVVLFPDVWPGDLDGFFRLRLLQVLDHQPPLPALSVVVLSADMQGPRLPEGFTARFRTGWPFGRCVFLTEGADHAELSGQLGITVSRLNAKHEVVCPNADGAQKIALHIQKTWGRCGNTILFENQVESLVQAGFLTIRLYINGTWRRGPTLRSRLDKMLSENSVHTGAHLNVVAVPDATPYNLKAANPDAAWRKLLTANALCHIGDAAVARAAGQAECVIANNLDCAGPAVALAPQARLLLAMHEDRAASVHEWALQNGRTEQQAALFSSAAARVQTPILNIADICTFVSATDRARLETHCRRAVTTLPQVYATPARAGMATRFDVLLVGADHGPNIHSMRWFLDHVWRPYLEPRSITVAIVGRAGKHVQDQRYASKLLHFLGFIEDLEAVRSWCRLTVVPDRGGPGISTKMLTTIVSGHPLATTTMGLRGLEASIASALPAHDEPEALAADILALIDHPARLQERRDRVRLAREATRQTTDHAATAMSVPPLDGPAIRRRLAHWARIAGVLSPPDTNPFIFALEAAFPMSGTPSDPKVLIDGWHEPESWGRWTDGITASMRIALAAPLDEPLTLELDLVPSAIQTNLRIGLDGTMLPLLDPMLGWNSWDIPPELTAGKTSFVLSLHAGEAVCPAKLADSPDDRILGIGVAAVRVVRHQPFVCPFNEYVPVNATCMPRKLLLTGWHQPEDWGCWTNKPAASLRLTMADKPRDQVRLELDLAPSPARMPLTLSVNNVMLPPVITTEGRNRWELPAEATGKRNELLVRFSVPETYCPARHEDSPDTRELGVGLRGFRLIPFAPIYATFGKPLRLGETAGLDGEVLLDGWHPVEDWGTWTSQRSASLRLRFLNPLAGVFGLELDLALAPVELGLTVRVNGQALPKVVASPGRHRWTLPASLTNGQRTLLVQLEVSDIFSPATFGAPRDDRTLGVGVRSIAIIREAPAPFPIGRPVPVSTELEEDGVLLAGWHGQENWGRWSSGPAASMLLRFDAPLTGPCALEFDLMKPFVDNQVSLSVNGTLLPEIDVVDGLHEWPVPESCTSGQTSLSIHLLCTHPARPIDVADSKDDRLLGVGVRYFRLLRRN